MHTSNHAGFNGEAVFQPRETSPLPLLLTIRQAENVLSLGKSRIYELIAEGRLTRVKLGGKALIPRASIESLVADLLKQAGGAA